MTLHELEPVKRDSIPTEIIDKVGNGPINQILYINQIETKGDPASDILCKCPICSNGKFVYSQGPLHSLQNGLLISIDNIWAYRCDSGEHKCPAVLLPEVTAEIRDKILHSDRRRVLK